MTKEVKDLYVENCKTLIKELEDDFKKWEDTPYFWIGTVNMVKMAILPKAIYRFNASLSNYLWHFSHTRTNKFHIYDEPKKTQNWQNNPEDKEQIRRHNSLTSDNYKATVIKTVVLAQKHIYRSTEQNRESRNKPTYLQSINLQ